MIDSVTLLGSSSGRNAGDAALISGIMEAVDAALARRVRYEIPTIKPSFVRSSYPNLVVPISMLPWSLSLKMLGVPTWRSICRTDLTLVFDAILFDRALYNPLFNFLSTLNLMFPAARRRGRLLGFYNVGAGPVTTPRGKEMLRRISDIADFITVRDEDSLAILRDIGVTNPRLIVTADAALNVTPSAPERVEAILRRVGIEPGEDVLAVNISKYIDTWAGGGHEPLGWDRFVEMYAGALQQVAAELKVPVLFIGTQHHDVPITEAIRSRLAGVRTALVTNIEYSHYDVQGVLGRVSLLFGMRLHATILASSQLTPILALPHQPKVTHYFKTVGLEDRVLPFDRFSKASMVEHLLTGWQERGAIRAALEQHVPINKRRARKAADLIAALDRGENLDQTLIRLAAE